MKALEKDRTRRYETANGLARDVERYLDGDPVEAGPPSASYKFRKFARKHRAALMTTTAFAFLLIAASVVSTYLAIRATRAERVAREQAAIAQAVNDFLQQGLLGQADVDNQARPGQTPDPDIKVRTLLDRASEKITGKFNRQPRVEAAIRRTIGETYFALGLYPLAETHLEQSLAVARRELGDQHPDTLNATVSLETCTAIEASLRRPSLVNRTRSKDSDVSRVRNIPTRYGLCADLGTVLFNLGKFSQAESLLVTTLKLSRKVLGEDHSNTLSTMNTLAFLYTNEGKFTESESLFTRGARDRSPRRAKPYTYVVFDGPPGISVPSARDVRSGRGIVRQGIGRLP